MSKQISKMGIYIILLGLWLLCYNLDITETFGIIFERLFDYTSVGTTVNVRNLLLKVVFCTIKNYSRDKKK